MIWWIIFVVVSLLGGGGFLWAAWRRWKREAFESCPSSDEVFDPETEMTDAQ